MKTYKQSQEELQEMERMGRSDYKLSPSGRKVHREITFKDAKGGEEEDDDEEDKKKEVKEEKMTDAEMKERERIVKGMKKNLAGFKDRYGDDAKSVMYATATKLAKEEVELEEQATEAPSLVKHRIGVTVSDPNHPMVSMRKEKQLKFVRVSHSDNKEGARKVGEKHFTKKGYKVHDSHHAGMVNEEVDTDEKEYGYEGAMAMTQLKTIVRHSEHLMEMLEPDTDLPEWVQSKITLATDYMQTAHDYLMSEMNEEVDQIDEAQLPRVGMKVHAGLMRAGGAGFSGKVVKVENGYVYIKNEYGKTFKSPMKNVTIEEGAKGFDPGWMLKKDPELAKKVKANQNKHKEMRKAMGNPNAGKSVKEEVELDESDKAWAAAQEKEKEKKLTPNDQDKLAKVRDLMSKERQQKEEVEQIGAQKTYKQFVEQILEYNAKDGVYRHSGSYGSSYDGDDEKKPASTEKRGRGRPAGSTSGARQKGSSAKKRTGVEYTGYPLHLPGNK